jgi:hypothetical protein
MSLGKFIYDLKIDNYEERRDIYKILQESHYIIYMMLLIIKLYAENSGRHILNKKILIKLSKLFHMIINKQNEPKEKIENIQKIRISDRYDYYNKEYNDIIFNKTINASDMLQLIKYLLNLNKIINLKIIYENNGYQYRTILVEGDEIK